MHTILWILLVRSTKNNGFWWIADGSGLVNWSPITPRMCMLHLVKFQPEITSALIIYIRDLWVPNTNKNPGDACTMQIWLNEATWCLYCLKKWLAGLSPSTQPLKLHGVWFHVQLHAPASHWSCRTRESPYDPKQRHDIAHPNSNNKKQTNK